MKNDDIFDRGRRLREERKRLGMDSQDSLAEILGVKKNSIVRYEKHNAPLDTDQLDILKAHGFNIDYVLWGITTKNSVSADLSEDEQQLLSVYRNTKKDMRVGLLSMAKAYAEQFPEV